MLFRIQKSITDDSVAVEVRREVDSPEGGKSNQEKLKMKKIIASAVGLMMVGGVAVTTASAVENQFGGYWRTRSFVMDNFDGQDSETIWRTDNRTRLYYTAKFNDDFKFVNKFEFNTRWGDNVGGDIGADGTAIWRIKNSYADFTLGAVRTKLGIQATAISHGIFFDADFSGINVSADLGTVTPTFLYIAVDDEDVAPNIQDRNMSVVIVPVKIGDMVTLTPYFAYDYQSGLDDDNFYFGADVDLKMDVVSAWGTFIYNGGTVANDVDNEGFLVAGGVTASIAHAQAIYATGDDGGDPTTNEAYTPAPGASYYWSEIMGFGTFDAAASNGSPGDRISNVTAFNGGVTFKPMDKLTLKGDVWYAMLSEEDAAGEDELGLELDGKATYAIMDNLSLDLVFAYLFSGEATGPEDVLEAGARVSLKF